MKLSDTKFFILAAPALLAACSGLSPNVEEVLVIEDKFLTTTTKSIGDVSQDAWWTGFGDEQLNKFVETGRTSSIDVRTALGRIKTAQSTYDTTGPLSALSGSLRATGSHSGGEGISTTSSESVSFGPAATLDLFGALKSGRQQALANLEGAELGLGGVKLAITSSIVTTYLDARHSQEAIKIAKNTLNGRQKNYELTLMKHAVGSVNDLEVAQSEVTLEQSRASLQSLETNYKSTVYSLAILMAVPAEEVFKALETTEAKTLVPPSTGVGTPADLLRNRPDVVAAEKAIYAAAGAVGIAKAQLYPSLSLNGSITATPDRATWSMSYPVSIPLLNRGSLKASVQRSIVSYEQAQLSWKSSVLKAIKDVQDNQNRFAGAQDAVKVAAKVMESQGKVLALTKRTYETGGASFMDLVDAERAYSSAELSHAAAKKDEAQSWARLQVASGRGWK